MVDDGAAAREEGCVADKRLGGQDADPGVEPPAIAPVGVCLLGRIAASQRGQRHVSGEVQEEEAAGGGGAGEGGDRADDRGGQGQPVHASDAGLGHGAHVDADGGVTVEEEALNQGVFCMLPLLLAVEGPAPGMGRMGGQVRAYTSTRLAHGGAEATRPQKNVERG